MQHLFHRLREIARLINGQDILTADEKELPEHLRNELEAHILAKEIELADLTGFEAELSGIEVALASYAGGPQGDNDTDGDDGEKE